jgi:hypothetical protein
MDGINNFEQAVSAIKLFGKPHWTNKRQGHRTWKWCVLYSTSPSRKALEEAGIKVKTYTNTNVRTLIIKVPEDFVVPKVVAIAKNKGLL